MAFIRDSSIYQELGKVVATTHFLSEEIELVNYINDILVLNVAVDAGRQIDTPSGWTEHKENQDKNFSHHIYWRRTTANFESVPDLVFTSGTASEVAVSSVCVVGAKTTSSPFGATAADAVNTNNTPFWNTVTNVLQHSVVLWLGGSDRRPFSPGQQGKTDVSNANASQASSVILAEYQPIAVSNMGTVAGVLAQSDGWQTSVLEVLDDGTGRVPTYFAGNAGATISSDDYSIDINARPLFDASANTLEGNAKIVYTFADSDVDVGNNQVALAVSEPNAHKRVFKLTSSTPPTGLTNGEYYYIKYVDASTIEFVSAIANAKYTNAPVTVGLSATGSGTTTLTESGLVGVTMGTDSDYDALSKNHHVEKNFVGCAYEFDTPINLASTVFGAGKKIGTTGASDVIGVFIDASGNFKAWNFGSGQIKDTVMQLRMVDVANNATTYATSGTLDAANVTHFMMLYKPAASNKRPKMTLEPPFLLDTVTVLGGDAIVPVTLNSIFTELNTQITGTSANPSALQYLLLHNLVFGNGTNPLNFSDSEKSLAFPPLADGVNSFDAYLANLGVAFHLSATDIVTFKNSQIGSSAPFGFETNASSSLSATVDYSGSTLVKGTATFKTGETVDSLLFVGGNGITHNDATIINSTFDSINLTTGYVVLTATHNISACTFKAGSASHYAIQIPVAGTYALSNITLTGFTYSLNPTHTSGTVNVNVSGGTTPTVDTTWTDNGSGNFTKGSATLQINSGSLLTLTALQANSEIRVYAAGTATEVAGIENSGTSQSFNLTEASVDIVIHHLSYQNMRILALDTSVNLSFPIAQSFDRQYLNP